MVLIPLFFYVILSPGGSMSSDQNGKNQDIKTKGRLLFFLFVVVSCLLACAFYHHIFIGKAYVEVELQVSEASELKIYWAESDQTYSERRMSVVSTRPGKKKYSFVLTDIGSLERLRLDTHTYVGEASLKNLTIRQEGYDSISIDAVEDFKRLKPLYHIVKHQSDNDGMSIVSNGEDPNFELTISPVFHGFDQGWIAVRLTIICALVIFACWYGRPLVTKLRFVPVMLFGVWMLVVAMAIISKVNVHPDEYVHLAAARYYTDNWLPPELSDSSIDHTFSVYGVSRLSSREIYYFLAGKIGKISESFELSEYLTFRLFNITLFGMIFFLTVKNFSARMVALPLLISPQIWYLFSYCNSDAFALFVAYLAGCQIIDSKSLLSRYLKGENQAVKMYGVVLLGFLLALMLLSKKNYYPFIGFFYFCLFLKVFFTEEFYWDRKDTVIRLFAFSLLGFALFGFRLGIDYAINGVDVDERIEALKAQKAKVEFKPTTPLDQTNNFLYKRAKGVTWQEMIQKYRWLERTANNSFGSFGYGNIKASPLYYSLILWAAFILLVFIAGSLILRGGLVAAVLVLGTACIGAVLVLASFHHSWVHDFQPQGRYIFAIFPMLGVIYGWKERMVHVPTTVCLVFFMFLLSTQFFIFQGLCRIPKPPF